jgi:hypothetical protein
VFDVAASRLDSFDLEGINGQTDDFESWFGELKRQGETHITHSDDGNCVHLDFFYTILCTAQHFRAELRTWSFAKCLAKPTRATSPTAPFNVLSIGNGLPENSAVIR